jgi:hypothetical protein
LLRHLQKRLWQQPRADASAANTLSKSADFVICGSLIVYVVPRCVITISSPRNAPSLARMVSDLCDADRIFPTRLLARAFGVASSIAEGSCNESTSGPPAQLFFTWTAIGGGGGAEVSASGDSATVDEIGTGAISAGLIL